jgi:hypothetical protein
MKNIIINSKYYNQSNNSSLDSIGKDNSFESDDETPGKNNK